jgi:hypothetical protein
MIWGKTSITGPSKGHYVRHAQQQSLLCLHARSIVLHREELAGLSVMGNTLQSMSGGYWGKGRGSSSRSNCRKQKWTELGL